MKDREVGSYGGRFVIVGTSGPETFNPVVATAAYTADVTDRLFVHLTKFELDRQEDRPALASSWECPSDAMSCTFHLRRGAKFSDGHPITAKDVVFSFAAVNDKNVAASQRDSVQMDGMPFTVEAPDAYTVTIRAPKPNAQLLGNVAGIFILPRHILEPALRAGTFNSAYGPGTPADQIVTSGPFRLKQHIAHERTVLTRNPYWFGVDAQGQRLPYLDELVFLVAPDQEAGDLKFRSGEVDAIGQPSVANTQWYAEHERDGHFTLHSRGPDLTPILMFFNQDDTAAAQEPPVGRVKAGWFRNATFRRAVSMAIDRAGIINSALSGRGVKSWALETPANKTWGNLNPTYYDYDPEQARRLLTSMGWTDRDGDGTLEDGDGNPISFSLTVSASATVRVAMANFIRDDLAKVGIKATLTTMEVNTLNSAVSRTRAFDAAIMGVVRGRAEPFVRFWRSDGSHPFQKPVLRPLSPEQVKVDELANQIMGSTDTEKRKQWLRELQSIVNEQAWVIWLPVQVNSTPIRNGFGNLRPAGASSSASAVVWNAEEIFVKQQRATN